MSVMKHGPEASRKFRNAVRLARRHVPAHMPAGFFLTDPDRTPDPLAVVQQLPAGVGVILRHFGLEEQIALAFPLARLCREQRRVFLVGADPATAWAAGASGVHWPARLRSAARSMSGRFEINTMSAHDLTELHQAESLAMDGVLISPVFPSGSPSAGRPMGLMRFSALARNCRCSPYGLGGIDHTNAEQVAAFGGFASVTGLADCVG